MAVKQRKKHGFAIYIFVLVILLIGAVALFIYGSMNNGIVMPRLQPPLNGTVMRLLFRHG